MQSVSLRRDSHGGFHNSQGRGNQPSTVAVAKQYVDTCGKCGATRIDRQIGLEPTVEAYVQTMVEVFREVKRVLRDDGTLWLNLGDSYATAGTRQGNRGGIGDEGASSIARKSNGHKPRPAGLKDKDLIGIPWRVAFALQADGWYLRSDIIWHKPNVMPESVTDRPTKSHEYLFLLTKSSRYYYDADAVREDAQDRQLSSWSERRETEPMRRGDPGVSGHVTTTATLASQSGRNLRSVWSIATQPWPGSHFATFPVALVAPCIKAGSKEGDTVLDPFLGAGTTLLVASRLDRNGVGVELSPEYAEMARARIRGDCPMFTDVMTEVPA